MVSVFPLAIVSVALVAGAVMVTLFMEVADATPRVGVTSVGLVSITNFVPVPVCEATEVALPTLVIGPVKLALAEAVIPVKLAPLPAKLVAVTVPFTWRAVLGVVVPIPTFPFSTIKP